MSSFLYQLFNKKFVRSEIHDDQNCFKCDVCLKVFVRKSNLTMYYRMHTRKKLFASQICDEKFSEKSNLVQHQTTHSEIKYFGCNICPEGRFLNTKS